MNILRECLIPVLMLLCLEVSADALPNRRFYLDSASRSIKRKMEHLDSTVSRLDRLMDSISGKQTREIDTVAIFKHLMEQKKGEQKEKEKLYIQIGGLLILTVLITAGWGKWKKRKKRNEGRK